MKKKTLTERVQEALATHDKPCRKTKEGVEFCAVLATVLAINTETGPKHGFEIAHALNPKTRTWKDSLIYRAPKTPGVAVVTHCPFCGGKLE